MPTWQYILIILAVVVLFLAPLWKGLAKRKAQQIGENAGKSFAAKRLPGALEQLSRTLELHTDPATASDVINQVVAEKPKKATAVSPGVWHLTFTERDDIHLRLTEIDGGVSLAIVKTIEFGNFPQGFQDWQKFRERVTAAAQARDITTHEGTSAQSLVRVPNPVADSSATSGYWVLPDA